jgi:hypothetical protein
MSDLVNLTQRSLARIPGVRKELHPLCNANGVRVHSPEAGVYRHRDSSER